MGNGAFEGWTQWSVGCHWSRELPDGRSATLSTWQNGDGSRSGYKLGVGGAGMVYFADLETAKTAFALLAEGRIADLADAPGASHSW